MIEACIDFMSWVESQGREHVMDGGEMGPGTASLDLKYRDLPVPSPLMPTPASINLKTWTLPSLYKVWRGHETQTKPIPEWGGLKTQYNSSMRALVRH